MGRKQKENLSRVPTKHKRNSGTPVTKTKYIEDKGGKIRLNQGTTNKRPPALLQAKSNLSHRGSAIRRHDRTRCHHGAVGLRGGENEAAANESVDSCNRATGTKHGTREKQPEKYEGGKTETRSRLFDEPTVPNDDARR